MLIFIIKYNGAFIRPHFPRNLPGPANKSKSEKVKYVDDGTVAISIKFQQSLVYDPIQRQRPLNYHERTHQILPAQNNLLEFYLDDTEEFTLQNRMKSNAKKTKVISFNKSRKFAFRPEVQFSDQQNLVVVPVRDCL